MMYCTKTAFVHHGVANAACLLLEYQAVDLYGVYQICRQSHVLHQIELHIAQDLELVRCTMWMIPAAKSAIPASCQLLASTHLFCHLRWWRVSQQDLVDGLLAASSLGFWNSYCWCNNWTPHDCKNTHSYSQSCHQMYAHTLALLEGNTAAHKRLHEARQKLQAAHSTAFYNSLKNVGNVCLRSIKGTCWRKKCAWQDQCKQPKVTGATLHLVQQMLCNIQQLPELHRACDVGLLWFCQATIAQESLSELCYDNLCILRATGSAEHDVVFPKDL